MKKWQIKWERASILALFVWKKNPNVV